ncbi:MAG TPA: hypothetical protein P5560_06515 [Thermotogota bacterium]|nr:hypothetical protein [Thermotogota bacterium]HRW92582.1 hypothetical protein [Thermotogota bacterium]
MKKVLFVAILVLLLSLTAWANQTEDSAEVEVWFGSLSHVDIEILDIEGGRLEFMFDPADFDPSDVSIVPDIEGYFQGNLGPTEPADFLTDYIVFKAGGNVDNWKVTGTFENYVDTQDRFVNFLSEYFLDNPRSIDVNQLANELLATMAYGFYLYDAVNPQPGFFGGSVGGTNYINKIRTSYSAPINSISFDGTRGMKMYKLVMGVAFNRFLDYANGANGLLEEEWVQIFAQRPLERVGTVVLTIEEL